MQIVGFTHLRRLFLDCRHFVHQSNEILSDSSFHFHCIWKMYIFGSFYLLFPSSDCKCSYKCRRLPHSRRLVAHPLYFYSSCCALFCLPCWKKWMMRNTPIRGAMKRTRDDESQTLSLFFMCHTLAHCVIYIYWSTYKRNQLLCLANKRTKNLVVQRVKKSRKCKMADRTFEWQIIV